MILYLSKLAKVPPAQETEYLRGLQNGLERFKSEVSGTLEYNARKEYQGFPPRTGPTILPHVDETQPSSSSATQKGGNEDVIAHCSWDIGPINDTATHEAPAAEPTAATDSAHMILLPNGQTKQAGEQSWKIREQLSALTTTIASVRAVAPSYITFFRHCAELDEPYQFLRVSQMESPSVLASIRPLNKAAIEPQ